MSALTELAAGALSGWVYTLVKTQPDTAKRMGIVSGSRIRQWHLDLTMLGGFTTAALNAVPDAPRAVQVPLAVGAWTNAMAFLPLAFYPDLDEHPLYRAAVGASFVSTSVGFAGIAGVAANRRRRR